MVSASSFILFGVISDIAHWRSLMKEVLLDRFHWIYDNKRLCQIAFIENLKESGFFTSM